MNYKDLGKKYQEFVYENYSWKQVGKNLEINYSFFAGEYSFNPKLIFKNVKVTKEVFKHIDNLVFNIGLVEMLSYWKAFCSPKIIVRAGYLDDYQINWWKKLLINGMGQYFYENKIDFSKKNFIEIIPFGKNHRVSPCDVTGEKILIPVGGGKDSAVTLELLSKHFKKADAFVVNPTKAQLDTIKIAKTKMVKVERILDKQILDLNKKEFLNGHTPFSALLSFTSILAGILGGYKQIVFSNEASSDEENVKYLNTNINHQYSKSFEFENDFREYNQKYLSNINYFSFLRPIYDIWIAKLFSNLEKYHFVIRSCNVGQKTNTWCGKCPKCLSTFILLYPNMPKNTLKIFGKNLLKDKKLKTLLADLTDNRRIKPFECVGTRHELQVALGLIKDEKLFNFWGKNNLPMEYKLLLYLNIKFIGQKTAILGYGREGKSTEKLLKNYLPNQKFDILDQKIDTNYSKKIKNYDLIIRTPGIPKNFKNNTISQTQIFLRLLRDRTIGITGTKGKSTTASLTYHILRTNKIDCELVGNIGRPPLDFIESDNGKKIYVYELSSHQLSDIDVSPRLAVLLNIYPEHLDYYKSFKDYKKAKENIYRFQKKDDTLFLEKDINNFNLPKTNTYLKGGHNIKNIKAAFLIAKEFGLSDMQITREIKSFKPLEDRLEIVGVKNGVTFINDGLATIPEASLAAIDSYPERKLTLILGGFDRGLSYKEFGKELRKCKNIKNVILIGQTADKIDKVLPKKIKSYNLRFSSMDKIVKKAYEVTKPGWIVLLSPAATSFDMFADYRDRDQQFKKAVKKLK